MKKKIYILSLVLVFSFTGLQAQTIIDQGTCGTNLTWVLTNDSILTINGSGAMDDYSGIATPWDAYKAAIATVIIGDSVTTIGTHAFSDCIQLTSVILSDSLITLGGGGFPVVPS